MDNIKEIKPINQFQPLVYEIPDTFMLFIDFTHPIASPSAGPVKKSLRTLGLRTEASEFTDIAIPAHNTLVRNEFAPARTSKRKGVV